MAAGRPQRLRPRSPATFPRNSVGVIALLSLLGALIIAMADSAAAAGAKIERSDHRTEFVLSSLLPQNTSLLEVVVGEVLKCRKTLDIAMYKAKNADAVGAVARVVSEHKVRVRFLLDGAENDKASNPCVKLAKEHPDLVQVRFWTQTKFHAKFVLADASVAMVGSVNWSSGLADNDDDLLITSDPHVAARSRGCSRRRGERRFEDLSLAPLFISSLSALEGLCSRRRRATLQ
jgi:PLD-like domain